ncbi:MAG: molybdopterin-dependent oxidoreductase [Candidatus Poribacteria bacterium]|nr:molybdopterin-dependent oxidoreductase [Candidatus Poribacteria bacterium]
MKRRTFIKLSVISAAGMVLPLQLEAQADDVPVLKPRTLITPNEEFYILQIKEPAVINAANWRLGISGLVKNRIAPLRLEDIKAMESVETMRTLKCIGDPIGTEQMGNAMWKGARLRDLLQKVGVKDDAKVVVFRCADGYHTAIPLEDAMHEGTILAYEMNGKPLPTDHGFPVRLLNPGHYGTKNPKWIVSIQLAKEHESYWEKRGWDPVANVKLATVIGTPSGEEEIVAGSTYIVSGAAFDAGHHGGIKMVEVSVDYGETWEEAKIWAKDTPLAWVLWKWKWHVPKKKGPVEIYARATTNSGVTQDEIGIPVEPVEVLGYHTVDAKIVESK